MTNSTSIHHRSYRSNNNNNNGHTSHATTNHVHPPPHNNVNHSNGYKDTTTGHITHVPPSQQHVTGNIHSTYQSSSSSVIRKLPTMIPAFQSQIVRSMKSTNTLLLVCFMTMIFYSCYTIIRTGFTSSTSSSSHNHSHFHINLATTSSIPSKDEFTNHVVHRDESLVALAALGNTVLDQQRIYESDYKNRLMTSQQQSSKPSTITTSFDESTGTTTIQMKSSSSKTFLQQNDKTTYTNPFTRLFTQLRDTLFSPFTASTTSHSGSASTTTSSTSSSTPNANQQPQRKSKNSIESIQQLAYQTLQYRTYEDIIIPVDVNGDDSMNKLNMDDNINATTDVTTVTKDDADNNTIIISNNRTTTITKRVISQYPFRTRINSNFVNTATDSIMTNDGEMSNISSLPYYYRAHHVKQQAFATMQYMTAADTSAITKANSDSMSTFNNSDNNSTSNGIPTIIDAPLEYLRINYNPTIDKPIIAIITSTQSTKNHTNVDASLLYKHLIKSIMNTVSEIERQFWTIHLYVAIDHTDVWWIRHWNELRNFIPKWLQCTICIFPDRKHHIPFNEIALVAYQNGNADYYCRVNDDTEFRSSEWITLAVHTLQNEYNPPNIGVVGPSCLQGNTAIMTHDFVHKTHFEIFSGYYYPPSFNNWYLDDWISSVYSSNVLGNQFSRSTVLKSWTIKHWMYDTRYIPEVTDAQWLPVEYERGRRLIQDYIYTHYPDHIVSRQQLIATTLPNPIRVESNMVQEILNVLPSSGNILIWGLSIDSHYWHRSTNGIVHFLEDKSLAKKFQRRGIWRDYIQKLYPYVQYTPVGYFTVRNNFIENFNTYVMGQSFDQNNNWCDLQIPLFPDVLRSTVWDVIIVDAPELCSTIDTCDDKTGPSILQGLYMTMLLVANQTKYYSNHTTHVFVDDYQRSLEQEFSNKVFVMEPQSIIERNAESKVAHYIINSNDHIVHNIPTCLPPLVRDSYYYAQFGGEMDIKVVNGILNVLPPTGNMLVWGIGPDCIFWHQTTRGRVIFLVDDNKEPMEINGKVSTTKHIDYYKKLYPDIEVYPITYSTENTPSYRKQFENQPSRWASLEMKDAKHKFPKIVHDISWDVIFIDDPLGCCDLGPGRLQSLYMSKLLATQSITKSGTSIHIFVDDYDRELESKFSVQFFDRQPKLVHKKPKKTNKCAYFHLDPNSISSNSKSILSSNNDVPTSLSSSKVVRLQSAVPKETQMGWDQIRTILKHLPEDGNLLVWGLGNDSPFWSHTTTGTVIFLEDGTYNTNLIKGKRWFDMVTANHPELIAYAIDYTTKNDKENYELYMGKPERWNELEIIDGFPKNIFEIYWDVILVDAPLGYPGTGPARYQSLYMSLLLAEQSANVRNSTVHVFVDDYERTVERDFSQKVFQKSPIEVIKRKARLGIATANEQAHFVFGDMKSFTFNATSQLVPWNDSYLLDEGQFDSSSWIILVEINDGYYEFFLNWLYHYEELHIDVPILVIPEDDVVYKKIVSEVQPNRPYLKVESMGRNFASSSLDYGTLNYKKLVSGRATHILTQLKTGRNVIYTDVDTVWKSNPLIYLGAAGVTVDAMIEVDTDVFEGYSPYYCTGFMAFVSNERTISFIESWQTALRRPQLNQPIFNQILHKRSKTLIHQPLPNMEFPSGQIFFSKMNPEQRADAVVIHNNYIQGITNKKERFMKFGLWRLAATTTTTTQNTKI